MSVDSWIQKKHINGAAILKIDFGESVYSQLDGFALTVKLENQRKKDKNKNETKKI